MSTVMIFIVSGFISTIDFNTYNACKRAQEQIVNAMQGQPITVICAYK